MADKTEKKRNTPRMMPNNLEAERAVLGAILIDDMTANAVIGRLKSEDFYSESNAKIFEAMTSLVLKSIPVDFVTVSEALEREGVLEQVGGIGYLTELTNVVPSAASALTYSDIVASNSLLRRLINAAQGIIDDGYTNDDSANVLASAEKSIFDIAQARDVTSLKHVGESLSQAIEKFEQIARDPNAGKGLSTGFINLDILTNGLQNSDLIILAARPAVGKTSFALNIAAHVALNSKTVAVFSLEMSAKQLMQRMLCSLTGTDMQRAGKGQLSADEFSKFWAVSGELNNTQLYIDDSAQNTAADILSKCRRLKREHGLDLIVIDYLQLMVADKSRQAKIDNRQNEVAEISRAMKIMAKELDVPIILLSQMSRSIDSQTRKNKTPMLSDLRESGAIEQDADIVMFLSRIMDEETGEKSGYVELTVAKHRNGPTDSLYFEFNGSCVTFKPVMKRDEVLAFRKKEEKEEKTEADAKPKKTRYTEEETTDDETPSGENVKLKPAREISGSIENTLKEIIGEETPFSDGDGKGDLPF